MTDHAPSVVAPALREALNMEAFVKRLYDLGVVDRTVTAENVLDVLQRGADRGVLPVVAVLRAALRAESVAAPMTDHAPSVVAPLTAGWPKATLREALEHIVRCVEPNTSGYVKDGKKRDDLSMSERILADHLTAVAGAALRAESGAAPEPIQFGAVVTEWPDRGSSITLDVGPDCHEYPAIGDVVTVVRAALHAPPALDAARPEIVCLCGSTRFYDEFQAANYDLTMLGKIVLSVGFYPHALTKHGHGEGVGHDSSEKVALDELHKRKIDLADRVYVLNVNGYIGDSTRSEIEYAERLGKPVDYLEPGWPRWMWGAATPASGEPAP